MLHLLPLWEASNCCCSRTEVLAFAANTAISSTAFVCLARRSICVTVEVQATCRVARHVWSFDGALGLRCVWHCSLGHWQCQAGHCLCRQSAMCSVKCGVTLVLASGITRQEIPATTRHCCLRCVWYCLGGQLSAAALHTPNCIVVAGGSAFEN